MFRNLFLCLLTGSALLMSESSLHPAQIPTASPDALSNLSAKDSYTVWYQAPGRRVRGISGLSYYDARQLRDDYLKRGWDAWIEKEKN